MEAGAVVLETDFVVRPAFGFVAAVVPAFDLTGSVLAGWDLALEVAEFQIVVVHFDSQAFHANLSLSRSSELSRK